MLLDASVPFRGMEGFILEELAHQFKQQVEKENDHIRSRDQ